MVQIMGEKTRSQPVSYYVPFEQRNPASAFALAVLSLATGRSRWGGKGREGPGARRRGIAVVITLESLPESPFRRDKAAYRA
jgi:hypothetical protein